MAFKAEELTTKIFPVAGWLACPEDTMSKGKPCPQSTHVPPVPQPCPGGTRPGPCPEDTVSPTTRPPRRASAGTLPLLQAQLRERLAARDGPSGDGLTACRTSSGASSAPIPRTSWCCGTASRPRSAAALARLPDDPDFYGVLRPRQGAVAVGLGIKAVDRETALLFLDPARAGGAAGLRAVGPRRGGRPHGRAAGGGRRPRGRAGRRLRRRSGRPDRRRERGPAGEGRLARLSIAALQYGQALAIDDPLRLSFRLYGYNRRPLTPRWQRLLASAGAVQAHLGIAPGGANRPLLDRAWRASPPSAAWLSWRSRSTRAGEAGASAEGSDLEALRQSRRPRRWRRASAPSSTRWRPARAAQFKIGAGAAGLLRPDKIVAYFPDFERLAAAAEAVSARLAGVPAQGVPFTSEIGGDGLLSWGMDPPAAERGAWGGRESWRLWLTHRLARALLAARGAASPGALALRPGARAAGGGRHRYLDAGGEPVERRVGWARPPGRARTPTDKHGRRRLSVFVLVCPSSSVFF